MERIVIIGQGGHARDLRAIAHRCDVEAILVEEADLDAHEQAWAEVRLAPMHVLIGINNPQVRAEVAARHPRHWATLIDPDSIGSTPVWTKRGAVLAPRTLLLDGCTLGAHVHINYGAQMTRTTIGDFTTIAPGVTICGDVTIGARCMIGAGSTIRNLVTIGDDVTVGAGAVVLHDVPDGETWVGNPARKIK